MSHTSLQNHHLAVFSLVTRGNFGYGDIEKMMVYEKDLYLGLLMNAKRE
jgi:hypothetical protein